MEDYLGLFIFGGTFFIFLMGFSFIRYSHYEYDKFKTYPSQQSNLWRSRMNAGGHGMVFNRKTGSISNAVEPNECALKIKYYENNRDKIFKSLSYQYFLKESAINIALTILMSFIFLFIFLY